MSTDQDFCVYMIACEGGRLYTGMSRVLEKRFVAHVKGRGATFTRRFRPLALIARQPHPTWTLARREEIRVKHLSHTEKLLWAAENALWPILISEDMGWKAADQDRNPAEVLRELLSGQSKAR